MNIGVANAAELDIDRDVAIAGLAPLERIVSDGSFGGNGGVAVGSRHDVFRWWQMPIEVES
jgi:hypothetical protein